MTETFYRCTPAERGQQIIQQVLTGWPQIRWLDQTDSTNAQLLIDARTARQPADWPRLLGTEYQTQGRGRAGRTWVNKPSGALMFSCGFTVEIPPRLLAGMAPALGIAACIALRAAAGPHHNSLRMKWPNDIMLDDHKLAGILIESRIMSNRILIVAGIGLNLTDSQDIGSQLGRNIGDWSTLKGAEPNKFRLAAHIAQAWFECLTQYNESKLQDLVRLSCSFDYLANQPINVLQDGHVLQSGLCLGIDHDGSLQIQLDSGQVQSICVGDISVRPVNNPSL